MQSWHFKMKSHAVAVQEHNHVTWIVFGKHQNLQVLAFLLPPRSCHRFLFLEKQHIQLQLYKVILPFLQYMYLTFTLFTLAAYNAT